MLAGATIVAVLLTGPAALAADPPITLRLGTPEFEGAPAQPFWDTLVQEVTTRSRGSMTIELVYKAGAEEPDREPITARRLLSGDVQLATIPVRTWNDVGVTSFQALMAPFLIDSDALERAVAADDSVLQPMLDGAADAGVVPIAFWPEGLRHLFTFDENGPPILSPADLVDQTLFTIGNTLQNQIMEGLGASTSNVFPPDDLVHDGTLRGGEYGLLNYNLYMPATVTADLILYPKYQVLVAEDAVWSRLSAEQQGILRDAAATARDVLVAQLPEDAELVAAFCQQGGRSVLTGPDNIADFQAAAQPIYDQMREDPFTAAAIDAISALKAATPPGHAVKACEPIESRPSNPPVQPGPLMGLVPVGTYRGSHSKAQLLEAGLNEEDASINAADVTWRFNGSQGTLTRVHDVTGYVETCDFTLEDLGDRVRLAYCEPGLGAWMDLRWHLDGDQLTLTVVAEDSNHWVDQIQAIYGGTWTKVE
jgi:TRAP-type C4-dicarboxylate transport system substrate-binding protein